MTWACEFCTFENVNDTFLACAACGSERTTTIEWDPFPVSSRSPEPNGATATSVIAAAVPRRPTRAAPRLAPPPSPVVKQSSPTVGKPSTSSPAAASTSSPTTASDPLRPVIRELVETERIYVKELQAIVDVFLRPLKARAQETDSAVLSESEVNSIFGNILEILRLNSDLLVSFDKALKDTESDVSEVRVEAICRSFLTYASHMKRYAAYAIQYDTAQQKLKKFESERFRFSDFINCAGAMNEITMNQPLSSFLIKPIQRICKYPLFFHQMIKLVKNEESACYSALESTLEAASDVASKINADKLRAEQALRAFEVAKRLESLSDLVLEPGRRYVAEWKCLISEGSNSLSLKRRSMAKSMVSTEKKPRTCFLFNDVVIVTKEVGTGNKLKYELRMWMSIDQLQFSGINPNDTRARDAGSSSSAPTQQQDKAGAQAEDRAFRPKLFQLPLDILHVASTDREKTQTYREKQRQAQQSQITQLATRKAGFLMMKKSNPLGGSSTGKGPQMVSSPTSGGQNSTGTAETLITAYTMWFRSPAERARVSMQLERTVLEFSDTMKSPNGKSVVRTSGSMQRAKTEGFPPVSPRRAETPQATSGGVGSGRAHFASSEDFSSLGGESPTNNDNQRQVHGGNNGMIQPPSIIRRTRSMEIGMEGSAYAGGLDPVHAHSPPEMEEKTSLSTLIISKAPAAGAAITAPSTVTRRSSTRPRPPPPPPPSLVALSTIPTRPARKVVIPLIAGAAGDDDQLISKWFGE